MTAATTTKVYFSSRTLKATNDTAAKAATTNNIIRLKNNEMEKINNNIQNEIIKSKSFLNIDKSLYTHMYVSVYICFYIRAKCISCRRYESSAQLTEGGAARLLGSQGSYSFALRYICIYVFMYRYMFIYINLYEFTST